MTKYEDMLNDVMPELQGCSVELAVNALKNACMELFQKSWIFTQELDPIPVVIGTSEYDLDAPTGYRVVGVVSVYVDEAKVDPISESAMNRVSRRWKTDTGSISGYQMVGENTLRVYRIPDADGTLYVTVALAPTIKSTGVETFVHNLYSEGIAAGAKARLMAMPGKPFSAPDSSNMYRAQFSSAISDAKWRARKSMVSSNLIVEL